MVPYTYRLCITGKVWTQFKEHSPVLTNCTGHKVDPGGLCQNVKPVTIGHQQTCRQRATFHLLVIKQYLVQSIVSNNERWLLSRSSVWCWCVSLPGTKTSPKPRREKGRSHRASGEKFNLGTLSTMGSWRKTRASLQLSITLLDDVRAWGDPVFRHQVSDAWNLKTSSPFHVWMSQRDQPLLPPLYFPHSVERRARITDAVTETVVKSERTSQGHTFVNKGVTNTKNTS